MAEETKAQRVERLKKEKCGLDILADLERFGASGDEIDADTIDRMKYYGLYTQKLHGGTVGQYLMLRIKLVAGTLNQQQLQTIVDLSHEFARGSVDFTTRQDVQLHWVECKNLAEIFKRLEQVGLTTRMGSGDCARNVVSCPVTGHHADELYDVAPIVNELNRFFDGNRDFINLPRKYKIAVSGCGCHCVRHEIQDLSFVALRLNNEVVFDVSIGGGLSVSKKFAQRLNVHCRPDQVVALATAVATVFRDHGNRHNRAKARIRHLLDEWGIERLRAAIEAEFGEVLTGGVAPTLTGADSRHHIGIEVAKKPSHSLVGCKTIAGRVTVENLAEILRTMKRYRIAKLRVTPTQDFVLLDVANGDVEAVTAAMGELDFLVSPSVFRLHSNACTGLEYCKFAVSETKQFTKDLLDHLEQHCPDWRQPLTLAVSGCPHGCSHPYVADIGLVGCIVKDSAGTRQVGYEVYRGGLLAGVDSQFAQKTGVRLPASEVAEYLATQLNNTPKGG